MQLGYHASHEQFSPQRLKDLVVLAHQEGFEHAMCSDHFHPWSPRQGHSGFSWSWLGSVLEASAIELGTVTPPMGFRYHPAVIAQAAATLVQMYPDQFSWLAVGSGEALNEHIVGRPWPPKLERNRMLAAAADIIRSLWAGETVSREGPIAVDSARLYCCPARAPKIICAALTPETAKHHAGWSDGLLTVNQPLDQLKELVDAYQQAGGRGKELYLQVHLSWAPTRAQAVDQALSTWRYNIVPPSVASQLRMPEDFDQVTKPVRESDLEGRVLCSPDLAQHLEWLKQYKALGFSRVYLHFLGSDQGSFIKAFASKILPNLI